nr:PREDICTED: solute carrier organic anion transporter family member 4A1-like [Bemisia tabaci]XP_018901652.1 PREDICTED: solute carrier organic anion transporter family member 4A1-like [Bemisia tabaci]
MIRPRSRLNPGVNEDESLTDAASYSFEDLNCGFKCCGLSFCRSWKRYATLKKFVIVLCLLGLLEGAVNGYLSAHLHSNSAHLPPLIIRWLQVGSGVTQLALGVFLAYWGGSRHRPGNIGLYTALLSLSSIILAVLSLTNESKYSTLLQTDVPVCVRDNDREETSFTSWNWNIFTIGSFFFLQFAIGVGNIAFMALGITYIDDNSETEKSPQFIALALAAKYFGPQVGYAFSYLPLDNLSLTASVWTGFGILTVLMILIISAFPGRLNLQLVKPDSINSIEFNRGLRPYRRSYYPRQKTGCFASIKRVLSIKMVVFNTLAVICVQTVIINFTLIRETYLGSVFMISKYSGTVQSRLLIDILQPPLVALAIILSGLFLRHIKPRASRLAIWNIFVVCTVTGLMFSAVYLKCNNSFQHDQSGRRLNAYQNFELDNRRYVSGYSSIYGGYSNLPGVNRPSEYSYQPARLHLSMLCKDCQCPDELKFSPVCSSDGAVYYSPCHAGCRTFEKSRLMYGNCTCMVSTTMSNTVSNSDCYKDGCGERAVLYQILNTTAMALLASTFVINMLFCFRCVQVRDKPTLVGLEMTLVAIVAFIPGKFLYLLIDEWTCLVWHATECKLHDALTYGTYLNLLNICFLMGAAGFYCIVYFLARNLKLYGEKPSDQDELQAVTEPLQFTISSNPSAGNRKPESGSFNRNFRNSGRNYQKPLMINVGRDRIVRDPKNGTQYPEMEREPLCWTARSTPTPNSDDLELNFSLATPTGKMFPLVEFPASSPSSDTERPKTPSEFSQPRSPTEISRPKTPIELFRPKTPIELPRPKTPVELSRPKTPIMLSRPKTPTELSRPKTPNGVLKSRSPSLSSGPASPDSSRPKTPSALPLSNSEVELDFSLQTPPGARSPGTTFRTDGVLTTLL